MYQVTVLFIGRADSEEFTSMGCPTPSDNWLYVDDYRINLGRVDWYHVEEI